MGIKIKDKKLLANFLSIATLFGIFSLLLFSRPAYATVGTNQELSFSGKITKSDNTNITDGTYNVEFKIYQNGDGQSANDSTGTGGSLSWTEDYLVAGSSGMPSTGGVAISGGTFQVNLGAICALAGGTCGAKTNGGVDFNQQTLWISIQIGNTSACTVTSSTTSFQSACGGDGEMLPMIRLTATPQALNADKLDGIDSSGFVQLNGSQSGNITIGSSGILKLGTLDTPLANQALGIGSSNAGVITMGNATNSTFLLRTKSLSTAIQVSNGSGFNVLAVDTSANHLKVYDGTATQGYVDIYYTDGTGATIAASSGTTTVGNGTGAVSITAGSGAAVNITANAASTWSTSAGNLTLDSAGGTLVLGTNTATVQRASTALTLDLNNASASTFTVTNAGAGGITLALKSGGSFAVGASTGTTTSACTSGQFLTGALAGGIVASGSCGAPTLQNAYDSSSSPALITTSSATKGVLIKAGSGFDQQSLFEVDSSGGTALLKVDSESTTDPLEVQVGSSSSPDSTQVNLGLDNYNQFTDAASSCSSTNNGALYYNTVSNSIRACVNAGWEDLASTGGLGLLLFGVVPDSANATTPGDIYGITGNNKSPCEVYWSATQQVTVAPCTAYSGGRKVIISSTTISTSAIAASTYENICLTGTDNQPALVAGTATTDGGTAAPSLPTFSANNPILCLATIKTSTTAGNVGNIYDVRTFTNTEKDFAVITSSTGTKIDVGMDVVGVGTTANEVETIATATSGPQRGVIVATSGTTSTTTINGIIATRGPQYVKTTSTAAVNSALESSTTLGYGTGVTPSTTLTAVQVIGGWLYHGVSTACNATTNCQYSALVELGPGR